MNKFNGTVDQIENNSNKKTAINSTTAANSKNYPNIRAVQDYVDYGSDVVVRKTDSSSIGSNNQLKTDKGLNVLSNGSVTALDDALIPYNSTLADNLITMSPPTGYNASGIFAVKISSGTNTAGEIKAKATNGAKTFSVRAYAGNQTIDTFPAGVINPDIPMLFALNGSYFIWMNYDSSVLPTETTLPDVLEVGKHYKISATSAITLKLPDTANDGDTIKVDYFNAGTASIRAQWCTVSTVSAPTSAPILSNNLGTGAYMTCATGAINQAVCVWSELAGKWTVDIENMIIKSK